MIENESTHDKLLNIIKESKQLVLDGKSKPAIKLLADVEMEVRNSTAVFEIRTQSLHEHHASMKHYILKNYSNLFCLLHDTKFNIKTGMNNEAILKLDKIIGSDLYANYVKKKVNDTQRKAKLISSARLKELDKEFGRTMFISVNFKMGVI